ncbi:MAG TPA: hypothetical protein VJ896_10225, partial [Bacteroidales bacterium]|nr:hypothetical protein [Bacteroidales bacterium]
MKQVLLLLFAALLSMSLYAQKGPGGVGNFDGSDGEPMLVLWLLPDSLGLSNGDDVLNWTDYSGNSNDLSALVSTSPVFRETAINGHDYVEFSKSNNRIIRNSFNMPADALAVYMVIRTGDSGDGVISYAVPSNDNEYLLYQSNSLTTYLDGSNNPSGLAYNNSNWRILSHQWRGSDGRLLIYLDGTEEDNRTFQSGATITSGGNFAIGGEQDGVNSGYTSGQAFEGDIAELIILGSSMKQADRVVIENYLAQKYGLDASLPQDRYIPDDASYIVSLTGMGKESDGTTELESDGLVITQNGGFDNGEYILAAHDGTVNSINTSPGVLYADIEASWERDWYIDKTGTVNAKIAFDFSESISGEYPANIENYRLLYKANIGDDYDTITVAGRGIQNGDQLYFSVDDTELLDGYYGLASIDTVNSPLDGVSGRTWYTLISGEWDNWEVWTLDPSGALPNNPDKLTPTTSPTAAADKVNILTGKTVTVTTNNKTHNTITIDGRLDIANTSGHSFGEIKGRGRILLSSDNFPGGDATHFISAGQGEGTVEYYGTSFTLNQSLEFYDLVVDMDDALQTLTLLADYTVNGNFRIKQGEFQINDNSSTTDLTITVSEDVNIETNGEILTGSADARHQLNLYGDFTNQGTAEFTNRVAADYNNEATDGIIDVNFLNPSKDQRILCASTTNFYRIEIDKGTDDTYELSIESTDPANFNLYGYASQGHGSTAQLTDNDNALGLVRGTVCINNNVNIPVLNNSGNYNISEAARLWVDGGYVAKPSGTAIVPYGKVRVSSGTLEARINSGITTRENGLIKVEGGTLNVNQIRTSVYGTSHVGGYNQSGGTVNLYGGNSPADWYVFNLSYSGNVFIMSGGTLHIHEAHGKGGIFIASDEGNQNVTGGTVIMDSNDGNDFPVTSTAPFWNVIIRNSSGGSGEHILSDGVDVGGTNEDLSAQDLVVLNDFTIESDAWFNANQKDVYIGRNFTIEDDALYEFHQNTTVFNGTEDGFLYVGDITGLSNPSYTDPEGDDPYVNWEQPFYGVTIDKPTDATLTLSTGCTYDAGNTSETENGGCKNIYGWKNNLIKVTGPFVLESGRFDLDQFSVRLYDEITNKGIFGLDGLPKNALVKLRKESSPSTRLVTTIDGAQFGNLRLNSGAGIIEFTSDVYVKRMEYKHGRINIGTHNLKIDTLVLALSGSEVISNNFSVEDMIIMDGNASDGGLSLYVPQVNNPGLADSEVGNPSFNPTVYFFPIGTGTTGTYPGSRYTPANIRLQSVSDDGYVTVNIVSSQLQTAGPHPLGNDVLNKYFRIRTEGFSTPPKVERYRLHVTEADIPDGTNDDEMVDDGSQTWNPAYVLDGGTYARTYELNDGAPGSSGFRDNTSQNIEIFYWGNEGSGNPVGGFDLIEANYTAGLSSKFTGQPAVFYNRRGGPWDGRDWGNTDSWYDTPGGTNHPSTVPGQGDIVVIRGNYIEAGNGDAITVNGTREVAEVIFQPEGTYNDIESLPRLRLETTDQLTAGKISGIGDLYLRKTTTGGATLNADIGEFAANDTSLVQFYMTQNGTYDVSETDFFSVLPTLRIYGQNSTSRRVRFNYDMQMKNLVVDGSAQLLVGGNYSVEKRTRLGFTGDGRIEFPNGSTPYHFITGEFVTGKGKNQGGNNYELTVATGGGNAIEHIFEVHENIELDFSNYGGTLDWDFYTNATDNNVILRLAGTGDHSLVNNYDPSNSTIELYKIKMTKGTGQPSTFTFSDDFTISGPTSGADVEKALILENGTLILDDANINIDLTTGDDDFYIPATACLEVRQGQANANGGSGILLDGKLKVSGGVVDMSGGDNYIQYSSSGTATLEISDGNLTVGSQIRRGLTSTEGILNYIQSGGEVIAGNNEAPENNRGVFEILNSGSAFNHTGGNLIIGRAQNNPSIASLYLDPDSYSFAENTNIQFGYTTTPVGDEMGIYATIPLPNIKLDNTNGSNHTLKQWTVPLTITDSLEIDAGTT